MLPLNIRRQRRGLVFVDPDGDEHKVSSPQEAWDLLFDLVEQAEERIEAPSSTNLPALRRDVSAPMRAEVVEAEFVEAEVVNDIEVRRTGVQTIGDSTDLEEPPPSEGGAEVPDSLDGMFARGLASLAAGGFREAKRVSSSSSNLRRGRRRFKSS